VLAQVLFAAGRQAVDLRVNVMATAVSVLANALLIPRFGAVGAAFAMVGTTTLYAGLQYRWVRALETDPAALGFAGRVLGVTGAAVATAISTLGGGPLNAVVLGGTTYVVGALAFGVVTREDMDDVRGRFAVGARWLGGR
jgi:O-antigen/teichoic acid export membrane protein